MRWFGIACGSDFSDPRAVRLAEDRDPLVCGCRLPTSRLVIERSSCYVVAGHQ